MAPTSKTGVAGLVLAAGKGTRMRSALPKVLHPLLGKPMLSYVHSALMDAGISSSGVVLGEDLSGFEGFLAEKTDISVAIQENRLGTADAVAAAIDLFPGAQRPPYAKGRVFQGQALDAHSVLICAGDIPAITASTLNRFVDRCLETNAELGVIGMRVTDPTGYGRLVLDREGCLKAIVEEKDADDPTRQINLCNTGVIFAKVERLFELLSELNASNAQGEYYLTDCFAAARAKDIKTQVLESEVWQDFCGVNNRMQLAEVEKLLARRRLDELMLSGVSCQLPDTIYIEHAVEVAPESYLAPNCYLKGQTKIGRSCRIGAGVVLDDVVVQDDAVIEPGCVLANCTIESGTKVEALTLRT